MIPTLIENGVTIADLAKHLKTTVADVEQQCSELNVFIGVTWANRPAISQREAFEMTTGKLRADREHERRWQEYRIAAEAWVSERDATTAAAARETATLVGDSMESRKSAHDAGLKAGREAGRQFEEEHPAPADPDGNLSWVGAQPRYLADGIFRRALDRLTGSVA